MTPSIAPAEVWPEVPLPQVELLEEDGEPLESPWHYAQIGLLMALLTWRWRERSDFYVGGNMFLYYSVEQARNRDYRGPDFFYVKGAHRHPIRPYWAVWDEGGRYPTVIVELLSPRTAKVDRTIKKDLYEQTFRTPEYFLCAPEVQEFQGWQLNAQLHYEAIAINERGWLWSKELGLWLGPWKGSYLGMEATWLRLYEADGRLVPLEAEDQQQQAEAERQRANLERQQAETERQRADLERQHADAERQRAEIERQHAEAERQRAEAERNRAAAAEAELERLRARLAELEGK
jgi:Uma2 family endonuclease